MAIRFNRNFNVNRVVKSLVRTILALYVGGVIMTVFGSVMQNTSSSFYNGLSLVGWTVSSKLYNASHYCTECVKDSCTAGATTAGAGTSLANANCITATSGSGVLAVIGIISIAQIVTEFVSW